MPNLRLPLTDQVETRDGTQTKDSTMVNAWVDLVEKKPHAQKRFGTSLKVTLTAGQGQALFDLQGTDYAIISDNLYSETYPSRPVITYTQPGTLGIKYQSLNSPDGLKTVFKTDYAGYVFDGAAVTKISGGGGVGSVTIVNAGTGGTIGTGYALTFVNDPRDITGIGAAGTYSIASSGSTGGVNWSQRTLPSIQNWSAIAWNGTVFCTVAYGTNIAATSTDGITWTTRTLPSTSNWNGIAWNGTIFCAIGPLGACATSTDGITWTTRTVSTLNGGNVIINLIGVKGSLFTAFGYFIYNPGSGPILQYYSFTSTDGITWTSTLLYGGTPINYAAYSISSNGSIFCVMRLVSSTYYAYTSPDGITWTQRTLPVQNAFTGIAWNGTIFCAVAQGTSIAATSTDGITWTQQALPSSSSWSAISWNGTVFCIISNNAAGSLTSTTGVTGSWVAETIPSASSSWSAITNNGSRFVAVAYNTATAATADAGSANSLTNLVITNAGSNYTYPPIVTATAGSLTGAVLTANISNYPPHTVPGVAFLDGAYYVMDTTGQIWGSYNNGTVNGDPLTWLALNVVNANSISGTPVAIARYLNYIIAFKSNSMEVFYDNGNPPPGSPLSLVANATSKVGCANAYSVVSSGDSIFFMSYSQQNGYKISTLDNMTSVHVSTPSIERIINKSGALTGNVYGYEVKVSGHKFYVLTLTGINTTLAYDIDMKRWAKWSYLTAQATKSATLTYANGLVTANVTAHGYLDGTPVTIAGANQTAYNGTFTIFYVDANTFTYAVSSAPVSPATGTITSQGYNEGYMPFVTYYGDADDAYLLHESNGKIYQVDSTLFQDAGVPISVDIRTQLFDGGNSDRKHISKVEIIGDKSPSTVYFRYTDDDYQTYCGYRLVDMSSPRSQLKRCGSTRRRAFEIKHNDNTDFRVEALEIDTDKGEE